MGVPDHLACLLRNPYAGYKASVRNGHGTTDWFQNGKEVQCCMSPCLLNSYVEFSSVQSLSHVRLFVTPMDCSMPDFPVYHQLPELAQTHVYPVSDTIQPSHPLLSPSAFNLSQPQGLFQRVNSSHDVAKILEFQPQHQSFQ